MEGGEKKDNQGGEDVKIGSISCMTTLENAHLPTFILPESLFRPGTAKRTHPCQDRLCFHFSKKSMKSTITASAFTSPVPSPLCREPIQNEPEIVALNGKSRVSHYFFLTKCHKNRQRLESSPRYSDSLLLARQQFPKFLQ